MNNCFSVAFNLAGMTDSDESVPPQRANEIIGSLPLLKKPQEGCLVCLETNVRYRVHAGVVTQIEPLRITHMPDTDRELKRSVPLTDFIGSYARLQVDHQYYEPRRIDPTA